MYHPVSSTLATPVPTITDGTTTTRLLQEQFLAIVKKYGWSYTYYQQLLQSHGHLLDQRIPPDNGINNNNNDNDEDEENEASTTATLVGLIPSNPQHSKKEEEEDTYINNISPLTLVTNELNTKPPLSTCVTVRKTPRYFNIIDDSPSSPSSSTVIQSAAVSDNQSYGTPSLPNEHDDDDDDEDDGPIRTTRKTAAVVKLPHYYPHSEVLPIPTLLTREEYDEEENCTTTLADLVRSTRSNLYGTENSALPTSPYDNIPTLVRTNKTPRSSSTKKSPPVSVLSGTSKRRITMENNNNSSPEVEFLSTRLLNLNIQTNNSNKNNPVISSPTVPILKDKEEMEYEEDAEDSTDDDEDDNDMVNDDDDYDYDDGFLVNDDEDDDDDSDDSDDDDDEYVSSSEKDDEENNHRIHTIVTPRKIINATVPKSVGGRETKPPLIPPSSTSKNILPSSTPKINSTIKKTGKKSKITVSSTPINTTTKTKGHPCACHNPSCTLRTLRDGDIDPSTGRIFIKEEHDKGAGKIGQKKPNKYEQQQDQLWQQTIVDPNSSSSSSSSSSSCHSSSLLSPPPLPLPGVMVRYSFRNRKIREQLTMNLYQEYNRIIFSNRLPTDLRIEWDSRLRTTAGLTHQRIYAASLNKPSEAWISLSIKVVDTPYRLSQTLLHEMCHVAQFLLDNVSKPPHGKIFMKWAKLSSNYYPGRTVTVCHNYEIHFKYTYVCENCGSILRRHSKSITENDRCGRNACYGKLVLQTNTVTNNTINNTLLLTPSSGKEINQTNGYMTPSRTPSEYQRFCNLHRNSVKKLHPSWNASQILSELARLWNEYKKTLQPLDSTSMVRSNLPPVTVTPTVLKSSIFPSRVGNNFLASVFDEL